MEKFSVILVPVSLDHVDCCYNETREIQSPYGRHITGVYQTTKSAPRFERFQNVGHNTLGVTVAKTNRKVNI